MKRNALPCDFSFFSPITFLDVETRPSRRAEGRKEGRDRMGTVATTHLI